MKNIALAICLLGATVALSACGTAQSTENVNSAAPVMEKAVTK
jgi:hypothetical protein